MTPLSAKRLIRLCAASAIGLGAVAGGIWLLAHALQDRDLVFQGKPTDAWLDQLSGRDTSTSNQALSVLNGTIIPALSNQLFNDTNDSKIRFAIVDNLNALPGVNIVCAPAEGRRARAAEELGNFGPAATAALPMLIKAVEGKDGAVRGPAAVALGKIHQEPDRILPLLIKALDDQDINAEAAEALAGYGGLARAAVPKLVSLLPVRDKELHHAVTKALKAIDPDAAAKAGVK